MKHSSLVLAATLALCTGCYKTTIVNNGAANGGAGREEWNHNILNGLANISGEHDSSKFCPSGWASIETQQSFVQGLIGGITGGIYTPQQLTFRCK